MMSRQEELSSISLLAGVILVMDWSPTPEYIIAATVTVCVLLMLYIMVYGGGDGKQGVRSQVPPADPATATDFQCMMVAVPI